VRYCLLSVYVFIGNVSMNDLAKLLESPCMCCRYNGEGYWQPGTHKENCPFHTIGGLENRVDFVKVVAGKAIQKWYMST